MNNSHFWKKKKIVSKVVVSGLASVAKEVGSACANAISETEWMKSTESTHKGTFQAAKEIGKSSLSAIVNVWEALETSGLVLLDKTKQSTVDVVTYKYGPEMGEVTNNGLSVGIDAAVCATTLKSFGVKSFAKKVVVSTGKEVFSGKEDPGEGDMNSPQLPSNNNNQLQLTYPQQIQ